MAPRKRASTKAKATTESEAPKVEVKEEHKGRVIKYMGSSDIRRFEIGETLLRSVVPLRKTIEWHATKGHLLHTAEHPEVPESFWDRVLNFTDFKDVTGEFHDPKKNVPKGLWETLWRIGTR